MRIALTVHSYPPARLAGTEIYAEAYARALARLGHDVFVFAAAKDVSRADLSTRVEEIAGVRVTWLTNNLLLDDFRETFDRPAIAPAFDRFLRDARPDLLHAMHLADLGGGILAQADAAGIPVGLTLHDYWLTCPRHGQRFHPEGTICETIDLDRCARCVTTLAWRQPAGAGAISKTLARVRAKTGLDLARPATKALRALKSVGVASAAPSEAAVRALRAALEDRVRFVRERVVPHVRVFLSPSRFLADELIRQGLPRERVVVSRLGIEAGALRGLERSASARRRIAFHGSMTPAKAPHLLVEAWASLPAPLRRASSLHLRGAARDPVYGRALAKRARAAGASIEREFGRADLPARLRETDLLVVPSVWWENSPVSILEAFAAGVPALVSDLGGMSELVKNGSGGYRFRPGDVDSLANRLRGFLEDKDSWSHAARRAPPVRSIDDDARDLPILIRP